MQSFPLGKKEKGCGGEKVPFPVEEALPQAEGSIDSRIGIVFSTNCPSLGFLSDQSGSHFLKTLFPLKLGVFPVYL